MTDSEEKRTIWCGNLSEKVTEDVLFELFHQGGPLEKVSIPRDRDGRRRTFGFITYKHECSVPYALKLFEGIQLYNRSINLKQRNGIQGDHLFPSPQLGPRVDVERQRTQSMPANIQGVNLDQLFLYGQNMFRPPGHGPQVALNLASSPYASQMGSSLYFGGADALSRNSLQGNWSNRNHPYQRSGGRDSDHNGQRWRDDRSGNSNNRGHNYNHSGGHNHNRSGRHR